MSKIAFVFPGQGAQSIGMGQDVYESFPASREKYEQADKELGFSLSEIIFKGPEDELKKTTNTQPALLTTSIALYQALNESLNSPIQPDYVAGHSLGEYSALVVAGVLSYTDAVRLVHARGQFMEQAVPSGQGAMAAVLGAEREALSQLCQSISNEVGVVEMANVNCPGQIVVSGSKEGVQAVIERGKEAGAKRVLPLEVSGPFHSSLMKPAADRLSDTLQSVTFHPTAIPVVTNVTARAEDNAEVMKQLLIDQVVSPVLWEDSMNWLISQGVDTFLEIGSGSVLTGLMKKIDRSVRHYTINSQESINKFVLEMERGDA